MPDKTLDLTSELSKNSNLHQDVGERVATSTCILEIHIRQPGFRKKIDSGTFLSISGNGGEVHPDMISISKELIDKAALRELEARRNVFLSDLKGLSIPCYGLTLGNGQYLVPISLVEVVSNKIEAFRLEREKLINQFEQNYEELKNRARIKLGKFFNESDYPPFDAIRSKYKIDYRFISNAIPEEFSKLSTSIRTREENRIKKELKAQGEEIVNTMRVVFSDLLTHLVQNLGRDEETGKLYSLSESKVKSFREFIDLFDDKNIVKDATLSQLVGQARNALTSVNVRQLKSNDEYRKELLTKLEVIKTQTEPLVKNATRTMNIDKLFDQ